MVKNINELYKLHFIKAWTHASKFEKLIKIYFDDNVTSTIKKNKIDETLPHTTFIHLLAEYCDHTVLREILNVCDKNSINVLNKKTKFGYLPIHMAAKGATIESFRCLFERNENYINDNNNKINYSPLHLVAAYNLHSCVNISKYLIEKGVKVTQESMFKFTPLHLAAKRDNLELVNVLLSAKDVQVNAKTEFGFTPLHFAVNNKNIKIVKRILYAGGDPNALTNANFSPFFIACKRGCLDICKLLWKKNVSISQQTFDKNITVLHEACRQEHNEVVKWLLQKPEIDQIINKQNSWGNTALHLAVEKNNSQLITILLSKGAEQNIRNENGLTVQEIINTVVQSKI